LDSDEDCYLVCLVCLVFWLNETNQKNQINQINTTNQINQSTYCCIIRTGLIPPAKVPSPGTKDPSCRLRVMSVVMLVIVSPPSDAKTDQRDETSAEQDAD